MANIKSESNNIPDDISSIKKEGDIKRDVLNSRETLTDGNASKRASIASNISTDSVETLADGNASKRTSIASNFSTDSAETLANNVADEDISRKLSSLKDMLKSIDTDNTKNITAEDSDKKIALVNALLQDMLKSMVAVTEQLKDKRDATKKIDSKDDEELEDNIEKELKEVIQEKREPKDTTMQNILEQEEYEIEDYAKLVTAPEPKIVNTFEQYLASDDAEDKKLTLDELKSKYISKETELFRKYNIIKEVIDTVDVSTFSNEITNADTTITKLRETYSELKSQLDETRDVLTKLNALMIVDNYNDDWEDIGYNLSNYITYEQFESLKQPIYINIQTGEKVNLSEIDLQKRHEELELGTKRLVEQGLELNAGKEQINSYDNEIGQLAKQLEETMKANVTKEEDVITEAITKELNNAYSRGMSADNIDKAIDYALDNIPIHIEVNGVKIVTSLGREPQDIKFSNAYGVTLINTKVDKIQVNNEQDKLLLENRTKLISAVKYAQDKTKLLKQELSMCIKNYETILKTNVKDRMEVYKSLFDGRDFPDSIKKEAINIVMKRSMEKDVNTQPQNNPKPANKKSIWRRFISMLGSMLGIKKKKDNNIEVNLLSDIKDINNNRSVSQKVQDLKDMTEVIDALNEYYLKDISRNVKSIDVVYKGVQQEYTVQIVNKNGSRTILDAKIKDGQIAFKEAENQEGLYNVQPIKMYNLSDGASVRKDLNKVSNGLEIISAKMDISKGETELNDMQNELFVNGRFNDVCCKEIIATAINLKQDMMNDIDNYEVLLLRGHEKIITTDPKITLGEMTENPILRLNAKYPEEKHPNEAKKKIEDIKAELGFSDNDVSNFIATQKYLQIMELSEEKENQRRNSMSSPNKGKDLNNKTMGQ